jgi:hypothetical protein
MKTMPGAHFYIVDLDVPKGETRISGFREDALETAQQMYLALEKETANQPGRDVVLVSVGSLESLKRAYPNYFADTDVFLQIVKQATIEVPFNKT